MKVIVAMLGAVGLARSTAHGYKVAFLGDSGYGERAQRNFAKLKEHKVDLLVSNGDYDYSSDPSGWKSFLDAQLGDDIQFLSTSGNHEDDQLSAALHGGARWKPLNRWDLRTTYRQTLFDRHAKSKLGGSCVGKDGEALTETDYGEFMACQVTEDLFMVGIGWDQISDSLAFAGGDQEAVNAFLEKQLSESKAKYKLCVWHRPEGDLNPGARHNIDYKTQGAYNICAKYGAVVVSGHSHVYGRSKLINHFARSDNTVDPTDDAKDVALGCGKTISILNGMGGADTDTGGTFEHAEWMQATWTSETGRVGEQDENDYGVVICDFQQNSAECQFLLGDESTIYDSFTLHPALQQCSQSQTRRLRGH